MFFILQQTIIAVEAIRKAIEKVFHFPIITGLTLLCIVAISLFLTVFFLIEHYYFNLSVVDFSTLIDFLQCPITTHVFHTFFCVVSWLVANAIMVTVSYTSTYILFHYADNTKSSFRGWYSILKISFRNLWRRAAILTCDHMKIILGMVNVYDRLVKVQDMIDDSYNPNENKYNHSLAVLLFPLLVKKPDIFLRDARTESIDTVDKKFGSNVQASYTFYYLSLLINCAVWGMSYLLCHYDILSLEQAFLVGLLTIVVYWSIVRLVVIVIAVDLYQYCYDKPMIIYSKEFVMLLFESKKSIVQ